MNKEMLLSFISKYNLGGNINAIWDASGKRLKTKFISDGDDLLGTVEINSKLSDTIECDSIPVLRTSNMKSLLSVMGNKIDIEAKMVGDKPISLTFSDDITVVKHALADKNVMKIPPNIKYVPDDFEIEIKLNAELMDLYVKAFSALSGSDIVTFSLMSDGETTKIIIGDLDENVNTDKVAFDVEVIKAKEIKPMVFNAVLFKEILLANKGVESSMKVSSEGLAIIEFKTDEYKAKYYLIGEELS